MIILLIILQQAVQKLPANYEAYTGVNFIVGGVALFLLVSFVTLVIRALWKTISVNLKDFTPKFTKVTEDVLYMKNYTENTITPKMIEFTNDIEDIEKTTVGNSIKIDKILAIVKELQNNCQTFKK